MGNKISIFVNDKEVLVGQKDFHNIQIKVENEQDLTKREKINPRQETKSSLNISGIVRENPSLLFDKWNTWEIMTIVEDFNEKASEIDKHSDEYEKLKEEYAQMLRLQVINSALIMTIDDFANDVKNGSFNSYDGSGCFLTADGVEGEDIHFDSDWILAQKDKYKYVAWYNK